MRRIMKVVRTLVCGTGSHTECAGYSVSALSIPVAFCHVSSYSCRGLDWATMPPPTGSCHQPPEAVMVRMRMEKSVVPSNPMYPSEPQYAPRGVSSSSAMISMARTLGAPVIEPPGKAAASSLDEAGLDLPVADAEEPLGGGADNLLLAQIEIGPERRRIAIPQAQVQVQRTAAGGI